MSYSASNPLGPSLPGYAPGTVPVGPGGTVYGLPLEPGERVVWFRLHDYTAKRALWIGLGVLFLVVLVGVLFIVAGVLLKGPRAHAITNRRVIFWPADPRARPQTFSVPWIVDLEPVRGNVDTVGVGGVLGAAVGAAMTTIANSVAAGQPKLDLRYWARTRAIDVTTQVPGQALARQRVPLDASYGAAFGFTLARVVYGREGDTMPVSPFVP